MNYQSNSVLVKALPAKEISCRSTYYFWTNVNQKAKVIENGTFENSGFFNTQNRRKFIRVTLIIHNIYQQLTNQEMLLEIACLIFLY